MDLNSFSNLFNSFCLFLSGLLVIWMGLGIMLFTVGLIRARNTTDILIKNMTLFSVTCLVYILFSYYLMYDKNSLVGNFLPNILDRAVISEHTHYVPGAMIFYQMLLAVIPLTIIAGATAERQRLWPFVLFSVFMIGIIYPIEGYWVWGNGFLKKWGFIDHAGAGVIHLVGAIAALAGLLFLGPRHGKYASDGTSRPLPGANMPLAALGTFMIWVGSFGFNSGTLFTSGASTALEQMGDVFLNTCIAGSVAAMVVMLFARIVFGVVDLTLVLNGAIVGLVTISGDPLCPHYGLVIIFAIIAAILLLAVMFIFDRIKLDDPVGAIASHGVGGICGLILVVFAEKSKGSIIINWVDQLWIQLIGIAVLMLWAFFASLIVWSIIRLTIGLRIKPADEHKGLDVMGCGMVAYPEFTYSGWEK